MDAPLSASTVCRYDNGSIDSFHVRELLEAMKVVLASPRGFCAGVNMAIESLDLTLRTFGAPVYVYHEIVHNKYVVETFRKQGAVFVDHMEDVPVGAVLLYSAHGVSPEIRENATARKLRTIDATCPLVTKVHLEAIRYAAEGYTILLIGHEGHDEVIGTMGEAPQAIVLVESPEDVDRLEVRRDAKLAYLTQTTLSVDDANRIIAGSGPLSANREPAERRHLLRHAESPRSGSTAVEGGRRGAGARQSEQLEQPAVGRAGS